MRPTLRILPRMDTRKGWYLSLQWIHARDAQAPNKWRDGRCDGPWGPGSLVDMNHISGYTDLFAVGV